MRVMVQGLRVLGKRVRLSSHFITGAGDNQMHQMLQTSPWHEAWNCPWWAPGIYRDVHSKLAGWTQPNNGVDEAGRFCTAAAKEYPAAMSKGLACPVVKALASRLAKSHRCIECTQLDDLFKWVDTMRAASNVIRDDAVVMPDYQCQSANLPTAMERGWPASCPEIGKNWNYLHTLSKTNIASGNVWLENSFLYGRAYFRDLFSFKEGNTVINLLCHLPLFVVMIWEDDPNRSRFCLLGSMNGEFFIQATTTCASRFNVKNLIIFTTKACKGVGYVTNIHICMCIWI